MNTSKLPSWWPIAVILAGAALYSAWQNGATPGIVPMPKPPGPDMVAVFAKNDNRPEAKLHAHILGLIMSSMAEYIEYDGQRKEPRINTGVQIDDLRLALRENRMKGWSFTQKYPDVGAAIEELMDAEVGTSGGVLTDAQRKKWVDAFRKLSKCCEYASQQP